MFGALGQTFMLICGYGEPCGLGLQGETPVAIYMGWDGCLGVLVAAADAGGPAAVWWLGCSCRP